MSAMLRLSEADLKKAENRIARVGAGRLVRGHDSLQAIDLKKPTKYKAVKTTVDGEVFDSKLEAEQWQIHQLRQKAGEIAGLRRQVKFSLFAGGGEHVGIYTADMVFDEKGPDGVFRRVVADVKSDHTKMLAAWRRTKKLMQACHGIQVRELP